jgi:hypothetical protein
MDDSGYVYGLNWHDDLLEIYHPVSSTWSSFGALGGKVYYNGEEVSVPMSPTGLIVSRLGKVAVNSWGIFALRHDPSLRDAAARHVSINHGANWTGDVWLGRRKDCDGNISFDSAESIRSLACGHEAWGLDENTVGIAAFDAFNNYFLGVHNMLYRSTNLGSSWARVRVFPSDIVDIATSPDGTIWVAASGNGIYQSKDTGNNWIGINGGLQSGQITCLSVQRGGRLFAGTVKNGIYRSLATIPLTKAAVKAKPIATTTLLMNPNPASNSTEIQFSLDHAQHATIELFDVLGNRVRQLVDEVRPEGESSIQLETSNLSNGTYFVRMQSARTLTTRKLVVLR